MHDQIRHLTMDFIQLEREHYSDYVLGDFDQYVARKRLNRCHGDSLELQAISELFSRPVEVYSNGQEPLNTFHAEFGSAIALRVSYHNRNHYNAVIDPQNPTCGVGLGLPGSDPQVGGPLLRYS